MWPAPQSTARSNWVLWPTPQSVPPQPAAAPIDSIGPAVPSSGGNGGDAEVVGGDEGDGGEGAQKEAEAEAEETGGVMGKHYYFFK